MDGNTLFKQTYALLKLRYSYLTKKQVARLTQQVLDDMAKNKTLEQVK